MVEYECIVKMTGERTIERRFFINSIPADVKRFSEAIGELKTVYIGA